MIMLQIPGFFLLCYSGFVVVFASLDFFAIILLNIILFNHIRFGVVKMYN